MTDRQSFGEGLREARKRAGFKTIGDFAAYLQNNGMSYAESSVQAWETGKRIPDRDVLLGVCTRIEQERGFEELSQVRHLFECAGWNAPTDREVSDHFSRLARRFHGVLPPRPDYNTLYGRTEARAELSAYLQQPTAKPLLVISGLGGMGKTALAYEILVQVMDQAGFEGLTWSIAKQEEFVGTSTQTLANPATVQAVLSDLATRLGLPDAENQSISTLQARLKAAFAQRRLLIYVDNLETLAARDFAQILYNLVRDSSMSRVFITSREDLAALPFVYNYALTGLEKEAALMLLREEAAARRAHALLTADVKLLDRVYKVTQGLPLALKLIVSQFLQAIPLDEELRRLEETTEEEVFYRFLYEAVWLGLSDDARTLLLALASYPGWTLRTLLQPITGLNHAAFNETIPELVRVSLVSHSYHTQAAQQMYDMHAITRWFVNGPLTDEWLGASSG